MKKILLPNTNLELVKFDMDLNGNKIIRLKVFGLQGFSIQTLDNLPFSHNISGVTSENDLITITKEVLSYIKNYGSKSQKFCVKHFN